MRTVARTAIKVASANGLPLREAVLVSLKMTSVRRQDSGRSGKAASHKRAPFTALNQMALSVTEPETLALAPLVINGTSVLAP